jgi:CubicO group peptidase (beta-lactamase class C family)
MNNDRQQLTAVIRSRIQSYLDSSQSVGLGIGVVAAESDCIVFGGKTSAMHADQPNENTLFEIGSITKVFTTTLLAQMQIDGELNLNDRVNQHLPPEGRLVCQGGDDVTLLHLATHTSGLPRLPPNLTWGRLVSDNPYVAYSAADLYAGLARCRLKNRPGTRTRYSNFGSGLLGHVLSRVGGADYERLLIDRVLHPLGMHDTAIRLSEEQQARLAPGHAAGKPVPHWDFQVLAGAGALHSTVPDMLRFLRANIDPASTPLRAAIELTHQLQTQFRWKWYRDFGCLGPIACAGLAGLFAWQPFGLPLWARIAIPIVVPGAMLAFWLTGVIGGIEDMALGWHFDRLDNDDASADEWALWHNGGTAGFASYLAFSKRHRTGVVLLANSDQGPDAIGRSLLLELVQQKEKEKVE